MAEALRMEVVEDEGSEVGEGGSGSGNRDEKLSEFSNREIGVGV